MSADYPEPAADEFDTYPDPPAIRTVETRGPGVGAPRKIDIGVTFWPRGHDERIGATVTFRVRTGTAELSDVAGEGTFVQQLAAVAVAQDAVADHPAIEDVVGAITLFDSERQWIGRCAEEIEAKQPEGGDAR